MPWRSAPASDTTEPPATPEVNLASDGDITEGNNATFTVTANPAPHARLTVTVGVPTDDYAVAAPGTCWSRGERLGPIPTLALEWPAIRCGKPWFRHTLGMVGT